MQQDSLCLTWLCHLELGGAARDEVWGAGIPQEGLSAPWGCGDVQSIQWTQPCHSTCLLPHQLRELPKAEPATSSPKLHLPPVPQTLQYLTLLSVCGSAGVVPLAASKALGRTLLLLPAFTRYKELW